MPLDSDIKPLAGTTPFYTHVRPKHPERESQGAKHKHKIPMEELLLHAPESERVADWFREWVEGLRLPFRRALVPLAHNWAFESAFLKAWMGVEAVGTCRRSRRVCLVNVCVRLRPESSG